MPKENLTLRPRPPFKFCSSLADEDLHGYGIMRKVQEQTNAHQAWPGLYSSIQSLLADGLIEELIRSKSAKGGGERRRFYRITSSGRNWRALKLRGWPTCFT